MASREFENLFRVLSTQDATDLDSYQVKLPGLDLPPPWLTWTLFALRRHLERQRWVGEIVRHRLGGSLSDLSISGALGHPPIPQSGLVPGLTDWEYYFHGRGCCLSHRVTGETIDVDFHDGTADCIEHWFFRRFLESLKDPEPTEARLKELFPTHDTISLSIATLRQCELLDAENEHAGAFRIGTESLQHSEAIEHFCDSWSDPARRFELAVRIGDWPAARTLIPADLDPGTVETIEARANECESQWASRLELALDDGVHGHRALQAIADLKQSLAVPHLDHALRYGSDGKLCVALEIVAAWDNPNWCPLLLMVLDRLNLNGNTPSPYLWCIAARFLLRHGYKRQRVLRKLSRARWRELGECALIALEHAPELSLPLIRRALRSNVPIDRIIAAATLALIDRPWCHAELATVLRRSDNQLATLECRDALLASHSPKAQQVATDWEAKHPRPPQVGPWITFEESSFHGRTERMQYYMAELHDRVMAIRQHLDDAGPRLPSISQLLVRWLIKPIIAS